MIELPRRPSTKSILRLRCPCPRHRKGANLADVTWDEANWDWTECSLALDPRPGVVTDLDARSRDTRRRRPRGSWSAVRTWHYDDTIDDMLARTYALTCGRCGRNHVFTAKRLGELWQRLDVPAKHGVVYADLGVDL